MQIYQEAEWSLCGGILMGNQEKRDPNPNLSEQAECDRLRNRWSLMLTGGTGYDPHVPEFAGVIARIADTAAKWRLSLRRTQDRDDLWDDLGDWSNTATLTSHYRRIWQMALAYRTFGSDFYGDPDLERDVIDALDWMHERRYNPGIPMYGNWWDWHIGVPLLLLDTVTLMFERLTGEQRGRYLAAIDHHKPEVAHTSTGANRVWECRILAIRGIVGKEPGKIAAAQRELRPVYAYATERDGFYRDGSYVQHDVYAYTGGYGQSLLQELSFLMTLLEGSLWEATDAGSRHIYRWVYEAYEPLIYRGAMMDMSMGRVVSRSKEQNRAIGRIIARSVIRLSRIAPDGDAAAFRSMVKEWILSGNRDFYEDACLSTAIEAKRIELDPAVPRRGELRLHRSFANMARTVHHRPGYAFAVSMHSSRIANYESINNENLRGWHTGDGMTYLYDGDLSQYCDDYWPTVDAFRLPGTTVLRRSTIEAGQLSDQAWAGGTSLLGEYGAAGMSLHPPGQSLRARKSWFMFDEEIVAIGSGIQAQDGVLAETVIDNRKLNGAGGNALTVNGEAKPAAIGWAEAMEQVTWMHLHGDADGPGIGYYFPRPATVHASRESRSGTWHDINRFERDRDAAVTRNYAALWLEHGVDPAAACYAYVLLPNKSANEVCQYAANPAVEVLACTGEVHAARLRQPRLTGVNVWVDGGAGAGGVWADRQASVLAMERDGRLEIAVSDPTFRNVGTIQIEWEREAEAVLYKDAAVTVLQLRPAIRLAVDVSLANGKTFHACFVPRGAG